MKAAHSLYMQTLGMVLLYLMTLSIIVFIGFNAQFGIGWEALLKSPFGDRVDTIADAISSNLQSTDQSHWSSVLENFDKLYAAEFFVVDIHGNQLAGKPLVMPQQLREKVVEFPSRFPPPDVFFGAGPKFTRGLIMESGPPPDAPPGLTNPDSRHFLHKSFSMGQGRIHHQFDQGQPPPNVNFMQGQPPPDANFMHGQPPPNVNFMQGQPPLDANFMQGEPSAGVKLTPVQPPPDAKFMHVREFRPPPFMHAQGRFVIHTNNPDAFYIATKVVLINKTFDMPLPSFVIARTSNIWQSTLLFDFKFLFLLGTGALALSLLFWWPFVHQIARAIGELTKATQKIAEGKFDTRIVNNRSDEIGQLSIAVNVMAERLEDYVFAQKRFLGDVSHELFSPLSRLHMAIELLESGDAVDAPRHFHEINEEIDEMKGLVNELIAYSKAGLVQAEKKLVSLNLNSLIEELSTRFGEQIEIELTLASASMVEGDTLLLSRAFSNIIRNSIRYASTSGPLKIKTGKDGEKVLVTFLDCGPGVPEETLKYLTEPFYRPEFSRNRNLGGFGLGLAIVKSCVEACNGSLSINNVADGGLQVQIRLNQT